MSGTAVPFTYIPPGLRVPLFYAEFDSTNAGISVPGSTALIVGQASAVAPNVLTFVPDVASAVSLWGAGSQIVAMIAAYMANDPVTPVWAAPYQDASGGTAATGSLAFAGAATAAGTLSVYVAGQLVQVAVSLGDTASIVAGNVAAAINAYTYPAPGLQAAALKLPVTAAAVTSTCGLVANNKGTLGNSIPVQLNYRGTLGGQYTPAGLTVTITAMQAGAGDPALTNLASLLGTQPFDFICNPYGNSTGLAATTALMSDQAGRWSYSSAVYGHVFSADADTAANLLTLGGALNDQHLSVIGVNPASPTPSYVWAAAFMGAAAPALQQPQPNRPLHTLPIAAVLAEPAGSQISFSNQQALLSAGISLAQRNVDGSAQILRGVTTYQKNRFGVADVSYLAIGVMYSLMLFTRTLKAVVTTKYPRALVAADGTRIGFGVAIVTPSIVKGDLIAAYAVMETQGLVQGTAAFAKGLIVAPNANDPTRLDVLVDPNFVSGLEIFATLVQFHLSAVAAAA